MSTARTGAVGLSPRHGALARPHAMFRPTNGAWPVPEGMASAAMGWNTNHDAPRSMPTLI